MFDIFLTTVNAVVPIILLIVLGYALKRIGFLKGDFLKIGNKLVFNILLPCMLFINIYDSMQSFADIRWDVVIYSVVVVCVIFGIGLLVAILSTKKSERRGVILQCAFRSNFAIIGLALVERLGGDTSLAGIVSAFSIPLFNILAVIALSVFVGRREEPVQLEIGQEVKTVKRGSEFKKILLDIVKNPLIIGVAAGLVFVAVREIERAICGGEVPFSFKIHLKFLYTAVNDLKLIASPLALIILGGQFEFSAVKGMTKEIIAGTVMRVVVTPLIGIGCAVLLSLTHLFTFGAEVYPTLIALFATPVAVSSAIMAGAMKNDEQLATQLVVWTSISSIVTIFLTVFLLMTFGLVAV